MTMNINAWLSHLLLAYYYMIVPVISLSIMYILMERNLFFRLIIIILVFVVLINLFYVNYLLSYVGRAAHNGYPFINSIIVRKQIGSMTKLKVISLAERLSGPVIGIYCYDLFPFTNYEFYVFCVNCVLNFILLMGLLN